MTYFLFSQLKMTNVQLQFGIEDLKKEPNQTACWDGVRNYQVQIRYNCPLLEM